MDLIDRLNELAVRIQRQRDHVKTEEAVKTAFVLPFIQALGYDIFNPAEVIPELTADHGIKKGEKVDYGIRLEEKIRILFECKQLGAQLEAKHAGQLFRYFTVTEAKFGVLTDGVRYLFYTDLEAPNRMDERPFFEFNLLDFTPEDVEQLKKFTKAAFDVETIVGTASNLKFTRALINEIKLEFANPTEEFIRLLAGRAAPGIRFTAQVKDQFASLTRSAIDTFLNDSINQRLKSALTTDVTSMTGAPANLAQGSAYGSSSATPDSSSAEEEEILTTEEELAAFRIIQAIAAEVADPDDIHIRDAKSYCAILYRDNNRRPIVRLYFNRKKSLQVGVFGIDGEVKYDIEKVTDVFKFKARILECILGYQKPGPGRSQDLPPESPDSQPVTQA